MFEVLLPRLDAGMTEGTIVEWLKKEGETIEKGEPLARIEGEKVIFEVEASARGILGKILATKGMAVPVGTAIAVIFEEGEKVIQEEKIPERLKEGRVLASPAAKRVAKERGINLAEVKGSGPEGMILEKDLQLETDRNTADFEKPKICQALEVNKTIPIVGMRRTIAERLTHSYQTAPHVAITMEVDMTKALSAQKEFSQAKGIKIPTTALLTAVVAKALKDQPIMNSTIESNEIRLIKDINVGIAIALEEGLIVPVVHHADQRDLLEIARAATELIQKAKTRSLSVKDLAGCTFTISNLGAFGVDVFTPIINPPQAAILGVGRIAEKLIAKTNLFQIVPTMTLTLVFDHRITDGAKAAQFLQEIKELLEKAYPMSQ